MDDDTHQTTGTGRPRLWPVITADDARGLIAFLVEAFGFELLVLDGEAGRVDHAELGVPGGGVMVSSVRDGSPFPVRPGTAGIYVVTDDPQALHDRAVEAGAVITMPIRRTDYGSTDFIARDPEGNLWSFGTYPGAGG